MAEGRTVDSDILPLVTFSLVVVVIALVVLLFMERERKKPLTEESGELGLGEARFRAPFSVGRTVTKDVFEEARDRLRILGLEREILGYAVRRLYEATAEGKITAEERDRLAVKYKQDLARIREEIARGESIVALNELERMQQDFLSLFSERFEELNKRIEELRTLSGFALPEPAEPIEAIELREPLEKELPEEEEEEEDEEEEEEAPAGKEAPSRKKKASRPKPPSEPEKSEAEKKVERIVAEVEKVLERLGQMEVEE